MADQNLPSGGRFVTDALVTLYRDRITQLIADLGRNVTFTLTPQEVDCPNCFIAGTMVYTSDGYKPIETIQPGDFVLTSSGQYRKVNKVFGNLYKGNLVKIKMYGHTEPIVCTEDHNFRTDTIEKIHAHALKEHKLISVIDKEMVDRIPLKYFETPFGIQEVGEDLFKILGWYIAEGCWSYGTSSYCLNKCEENYVEEIYESIKRISNIESKKIYRPDSQNLVLECYNVIFSDWMKNLCGHTAQNKQIPDDLYNTLSLNQLLQLIHYYWLGDGTYLKRDKEYSVKTISKKLAYQIYAIWQNAGYNPFIRFREKYIDKKGQKHKSSYQIGYFIGLQAGKHRHKVYKVDKYFDTTIVYNLNVDSEHDYVVNGVSVFNCGWDYSQSRSNNIYTANASGVNYNKSFPTGTRCPVCFGKGKLEFPRTATHKCLIGFPDPDEFDYEAFGLKPTQVIRLKNRSTVSEDLEKATYAVIDGFECEKLGIPKRSGLRDIAFVSSFWKRRNS